TDYGVSAERRAIAAVPLEVDGRAFGVLGFFWNERHALPPDRQAFIAALARLGASAMERGRLFDAERAALRRAEAAQRRLTLIGEAGRILAMSSDFDVIIDRLAGLGLPDLGDACVVEIPDDPRPRHVALADVSLGTVASALEGGRLDPAPDGPVARV